jgi:hypothetical protein
VYVLLGVDYEGFKEVISYEYKNGLKTKMTTSLQKLSFFVFRGRMAIIRKMGGKDMLAHILGFFAVASFLWCFQLKTRRNIILVNITSRVLYILQYLLLGAFEGAVLDFMGLLLSFFAQKKDRFLRNGPLICMNN